MKHLLLAACALTLGAALLGAACGGGDDNGMTLEEYLREFERLQDEGEARIDEASESAGELPEDPSVEQIKEAFGPLYAEFADAIDQFREELASLDPPDEAQDAHEAVSEAFEVFEQEFEQVRDSIESATTREELEELSDQFGESERAQEASDRLDEACRELQGLADENDIDVDLECEDSD